MTQAAHKRWLLVTAVVVGAFAPVFLLATRESTAGMAEWTLELLNGPGGDSERFSDGTAQFVSALTGGFLAGWGLMIFCLRAWVYDAAPEGVRRSVLAGVAAWFLFDSTGSTMSGNAWNVASNVLVALIAIGPMWRPARG